jgi:hypothetical protein
MNWEDKYVWVGSFYEGRTRVKSNEKWGFVDTDGNEVIPLKYDYVGNFYDGRARVEFMCIKGTVDLNGKEYFSREDLAKLRKYRLPNILDSIS